MPEGGVGGRGDAVERWLCCAPVSCELVRCRLDRDKEVEGEVEVDWKSSLREGLL